MTELEYREKCLQQQINACVVCGTDTKLVVHHIDGDRDNNSLDNLAPVCRSCHRKIHSPFSHGPVFDRYSERIEYQSDDGQTRTSISLPDWMDAELRARQTDGASEHIREALIARWLLEDSGEWDTPEIDPELIDLQQNPKEAVPDGGSE